MFVRPFVQQHERIACNQDLNTKVTIHIVNVIIINNYFQRSYLLVRYF